MSKPIFVAPYQELLQVARGLAHAGHQIITVNQQFQQALSNMELPQPVLLLGSNIPAEARNSIAVASANIIRGINYPLPSKGVSPVVAEFLNTNLSGYLVTRLNEMAFTVAALDNYQPSLVVLHNDVEPWMRIIALWAKARNVPCLHVPHAIYLDTNERGAPGTDIHDMISSSHIAVSGPYQAKWYAERAKLQHVKPGIVVTGLPQFDRLARPRMDRAQSHYLLKLDPKRPVITYMSSWRQDTNLLGCTDVVDEGYRAFLAAAAQLGPSYQYVIKLHYRAGEQSHQWHMALAKESGVPLVIDTQHIDVVLNSSDMYISIGPSNAILEAAMVGTARVAAINGFYYDNEVLKIEPNPDSIAAAIRTAIVQPVPDYSQFLSKYTAFRDGQNTARIVQLALDLVRSN